ncbi:hypothetical protein H1R20_g13690, partial [Candolleomyces eurysporus]
MDPPRRPRRRDEAKNFLKRPVKFFKEHLGSRTPSLSRSRLTSHPNVAGTSSKASHDVPTPDPPAEDTNRGEIQNHQDNIDTAIGRQLPQDHSSQAIQASSSEVVPFPPAQSEENALMPSTSAFDHGGASRVSNLFSPSERLARSRGEGEREFITAHTGHPSQALSGTVVEADLPIRSNSPAAATSHGPNEHQDGPAHVEHQPAGPGSKIYDGVKTTLRRIAEISDVFPPLKSTARALLAICNTIDAYSENVEEFHALLKRVEALSRIIDNSPPDVQQGVKDRFSGLSRTLDEKEKILQDKVNPNRSRIDRAFLTDQDKQEVLKLTQEIRFAIEIAMFDVTMENMTQTLKIVSGVDWLKERIEIIEDHTGAMHNIEEAVLSLKRSIDKIRYV